MRGAEVPDGDKGGKEEAVKIGKHVLYILLGLFVCLGIPTLRYADIPGLLKGSGDAVSSASMVISDAPSGEYLVLVNEKYHPLSMEEWEKFFSEQPVGVILEDIRCFVPAGDTNGIELAKRYQARLAENQMRFRAMDGLLLVSRAEHGLFDVIVLSKEAAEAYGYGKARSLPGVRAIPVTGGSV